MPALKHVTNRRHGVLSSQSARSYSTSRTWRVYSPLSREWYVASLRTVGGLRLELSLGA